MTQVNKNYLNKNCDAPGGDIPLLLKERCLHIKVYKIF